MDRISGDAIISALMADPGTDDLDRQVGQGGVCYRILLLVGPTVRPISAHLPSPPTRKPNRRRLDPNGGFAFQAFVDDKEGSKYAEAFRDNPGFDYHD